MRAPRAGRVTAGTVKVALTPSACCRRSASRANDSGAAVPALALLVAVPANVAAVASSAADARAVRPHDGIPDL